MLGGGVWWLDGVHLRGNTKRRKRKHEKQFVLWIVKKQWKRFFIVLKKVVFENMGNTKNENAPPSPNMFVMFFVFKNKKQFLKIATK